MKAAGARPAGKQCRAAFVALLSLTVASCSSTADPALEFASQASAVSETEGTEAEGMAADAASEQLVAAEGQSDLSGQLAALPAAGSNGESSPPASAEASAEPTPAPSPDKAAEPAAVAVAADAVAANGEAVLTTDLMAPPAIEPKKKSFLSSFFGAAPASAVSTPPRLADKALPELQPKAKPLIVLASAEPKRKQLAGEDDGGGLEGLPGVRQNSLFEITHKSGIDDDSDVDLYEGQEGSVQLASAAGFARLAPNGLLKQRDSVDVACLKPNLVRLLKTVERHFGKKMVVTSGYRSPAYNRKVRGARKSQHMSCAAADVQIPGVSKWDLAKFVRAQRGRGGVGTYCHTASVHIDVGPERDWNWKCRRKT